MVIITVSFCDTGSMNASDKKNAEAAYIDALLSLVNDGDILKSIHKDDQEGIKTGADHFENCESTWSKLDKFAMVEAEKAIGYWPKESAHFEVSFN